MLSSSYETSDKNLGSCISSDHESPKVSFEWIEQGEINVATPHGIAFAADGDSPPL